MDNLPCVTKAAAGAVAGTGDEGGTKFVVGYPLGFLSPDEKRAFINNHLEFNILYHTDDEYVSTMTFAFCLLPIS